MEIDDNLLIYVEINQKAESVLNSKEVEREVEAYFMKAGEILPGSILHNTVFPLHVNYVRICSVEDEKYKIQIPASNVIICYYVFQTSEDTPQIDSVEEENEDVPASLNWQLPNVEFEGLWESLYLDEGLKEQLISYVQTTLLYSQNQVSAQIVRWNGIVLLHGPPGTGKTTLCKALAQKLSIRLSRKYRSGQLIEINTHSLFSKWFSESAKLVLKMFAAIRQWLETDDHFVCILIDEVESLTHARQLNGTDPSDSIRVVNAVLTQIDQLQRYRNVLILATSNVTEAIDIAFADRADLKLYIGYPSKWAVYEILRSCIEELIRCKLIIGSNNDLFEASLFRKLASKSHDGDCLMTEVVERSKELLELSLTCGGLSGRTLRKIPFLTSTKFVDKPCPTVSKFLGVMKQVILKHIAENKKFYNTEKHTMCNSLLELGVV